MRLPWDQGGIFQMPLGGVSPYALIFESPYMTACHHNRGPDGERRQGLKHTLCCLTFKKIKPKAFP